MPPEGEVGHWSSWGPTACDIAFVDAKEALIMECLEERRSEEE